MNWTRGCQIPYTPLRLAMGNDTLIIELYDTFVGKQDFSDLNEWKEEIDVKFPMRKAEECKAKMGK